MFTIDVKYTNFNGEERTKRCYFHLSKVELKTISNTDLMAMMTSIVNDADKIEKFKNSPDEYAREIGEYADKVYNAIIALIDLSYGEMSEDGETFDKTPDLLEKLKKSPVYDALVYNYLTKDPSVFEAFVNGIIPLDLRSEIDQKMSSNKMHVKTSEERLILS